MNVQQKHKVPLKVKLYRIKNTGFLTFTDSLIRFIKPPKKYKKHLNKILFVRNDKIGDALVTVPVLRDLKLNYPDLKIDVLCSPVNKFVFEGIESINKLHILKNSELVGGLKAEKYDAIVDLLSTTKKLIRILKRCSPFVAGSRIFGFSWMYNYYLPTNWVSEYDNEPMSFKIEKLLTDCFGFEFAKRDSSEPYSKKYQVGNEKKEYDLLFHLGTGEMRKLDMEIEDKLLEILLKYRVLITDGGETKRFIHYKNKYSTNNNFTFKLYKSLEEIQTDILKTRLVLCYDGGQAHFMGQFSRCLVLTGSVSPLQWAPYDFSKYTKYKSIQNGVVVLQSEGRMKHRALYSPIWCLPCFDIGCNTRPCINNILPEQVLETINEMLEQA